MRDVSDITDPDLIQKTLDPIEAQPPQIEPRDSLRSLMLETQYLKRSLLLLAVPE